MTRVRPGWKPEDDLPALGFHEIVRGMYETAGCCNVRVTEPAAGICYVLYGDPARPAGMPTWSKKFFRLSVGYKMDPVARMEVDLRAVPPPPLFNPGPVAPDSVTERVARTISERMADAFPVAEAPETPRETFWNSELLEKPARSVGKDEPCYVCASTKSLLAQVKSTKMLVCAACAARHLAPT